VVSPSTTLLVLRDAVDHARLNVVRAPGRAIAFGRAAFVAAGLLTFSVTAAASRQSDVTGTFDALAASRVQVSTPISRSPYGELSDGQLEAIRRLPGVTGVAWGSWKNVLARDGQGRPTSTRLWRIDGDLDVLGLDFADDPHDVPTYALVVGGASALADVGERRFEHAVVAGRKVLVGGTLMRSPAISDLLQSVTVAGQGSRVDMRQDGELVVRISRGWATVVAPRLAAPLAPGHESSVLVRYPPEAASLRSNVLGSVDTMVYLASGAILILGAGAVMVGTFFRVLSERRLLGLYRAIGASSGFVVLTLILEASLVGVAGSALGSVVGLGVAGASALAEGRGMLVPWPLVGAGALLGIVTNGLGALLPSIRTVREPPLLAIRSR